MALFSQRKGIRPAAKAIQRESIDEDLRNRLWSGLKLVLWDNWHNPDLLGSRDDSTKRVESLVRDIWLHHFKLPIDTMPAFDRDYPKSAYEQIRDHFFTGEWWQAYDLIEFLMKNMPDNWKETLGDVLNSYMESENAAYRIVGAEVVEITDEQEIEAIESALDGGTKSCQSHLGRALELASDRKQPGVSFRSCVWRS